MKKWLGPFVLRVVKKGTLRRIVLLQKERQTTMETTQNPKILWEFVTGAPAHNSLQLKFFYISTDVARRSTHCHDVKSQSTMPTLSHTRLVLYATVKVTLPRRVRKTRPKVCILTEAAVSCAAILRIWRETAGYGGEVYSLPNGYL